MKVNLAFDVSAISTFSEKSNDVLYNGILTGPTLANYQIIHGINGTQLVNFVDVTAFEQASACSLGTSGSTVLTNKSLTVADFTFVNDVCMRDIDGYPFPTVAGVVYDNIESRLMDAMVGKLYQRVKQRIDLTLWQGTTAAGYLLNGLTYQASACTDRTIIETYNRDTFPYSAVTATNIDNVFQEFVENMTQDMTMDGPLVINVPFSYYNLYSIWRANNVSPSTMDGIGSVGFDEQWLVGFENKVKLRVQPGYTGTDYMLMTADKNIGIGTDIPAELINLSNARFEFDNINRIIYHFLDFRLGCLFVDCSKVVTNF